MTEKIGWSHFARERYRLGQGHSFFRGSETELIALVHGHWHARRPGAGRSGLDEVVVVPVPPERFACAVAEVDEETPLTARLVRRQPQEDPYIEVRAEITAAAPRFASVVLYSAATLRENEGQRSGDFDWEIVSIQASPVENEPMRPLTMARNFLAKPGGTPCEYTAREFAEAVYYWSRRCGIEKES